MHAACYPSTPTAPRQRPSAGGTARRGQQSPARSGPVTRPCRPLRFRAVRSAGAAWSTTPALAALSPHAGARGYAGESELCPARCELRTLRVVGRLPRTRRPDTICVRRQVVAVGEELAWSPGARKLACSVLFSPVLPVASSIAGCSPRSPDHRAIGEPLLRNNTRQKGGAAWGHLIVACVHARSTAAPRPRARASASGG